MAIGIILLALSYIICGHSLLNHDAVTWLHSPRVTPWGRFGSKELCPKNNFVTGMRLKMDHQHLGDNTALNAVQLLCTTSYGENSENVTSATGRFGNYGNTKYCASGFATGYQLRSQNGQGNARDDVAAVDFKLICTDFGGRSSHTIDSDNTFLPWGYWTKERHCPLATAVCGISTQVEDLGENLKNEDETTLNNVDIACCPIIDPIKICQLKYYWKTVMACRSETLTCEIRLSTGMIVNEQLLKFIKLYEKKANVAKFINKVVKALKNKAKKYPEKVNNYSLKHIISEANTKRAPFSVKCESTVQQLVITCGYIKLYTYKRRCVPNLYAEKEWETTGLYFRPTSHLKTVFWSYNCDFTGGENVKIQSSEIADCGDSCFSNIECTHFVWNMFNGGTCWMKSSRTTQTPVEKYDENFLCGWIERNRNDSNWNLS